MSIKPLKPSPLKTGCRENTEGVNRTNIYCRSCSQEFTVQSYAEIYWMDETGKVHLKEMCDERG